MADLPNRPKARFVKDELTAPMIGVMMNHAHCPIQLFYQYYSNKGVGQSQIRQRPLALLELGMAATHPHPLHDGGDHDPEQASDGDQGAHHREDQQWRRLE